jgi:ornithine cyclodeaminase
MTCVRPIKRVRVAARTFESAQRFAKEMQAAGSADALVRTSPTSDTQHPTPIIVPVESAEAAVRGADLIVTATTSFEPVVKRGWISPGAHINAVGTYSPKARELDTATMAAATLFADARESALNEAGDYILAAAEGAIVPEHIRAELGEVLIGAYPARTSEDEITVFKSLGLAIEDLAAAAHVYEKARTQSLGSWVEFD